MRILFCLILFSFVNCFTIYTKGETILQSEKINTKKVKEEKDVFVLTHSFTNDGLYLLLDGYRVEEDNQIDLIKEKYKENKDFKLNDYSKKIASDNKKDNKPICNTVSNRYFALVKNVNSNLIVLRRAGIEADHK
jgi:hypothetical protein